MTMRLMVLLVAFANGFMAMSAHAAIFSCKGADGSRVFSDTPCESETKKTEADTKAAAPAPTTQQAGNAKASSAATTDASVSSSGVQSDPMPSASIELQEAQAKCKQGQKNACQDVARLEKRNQDKFREDLQRGCERGSATECEELHCRGGIGKPCRDAMTKTGAIVGSNWYIRKQAAPVRASGSTEYVHVVTCDPKAQILKDTTVYCAAESTHCGTRFEPKKVKTLEAAADHVCTRH